MERALVVTEATEKPAYQRVLLSPRPTPPRTGQFFQRLARPYDIPYICNSAAQSTYLAVDFETRGNDYSSDLDIVGVGLAWSHGSAYIHWTDLSWNSRKIVRDLLTSHQGLLAHNVYFDGGVALKHFGVHLQWKTCTLALYQLLSNEGWAGQSHGLKAAMTEILQWEDSNEKDLDEWLVTHGYYKGSKRKDESEEGLLLAYTEGTLRPEKGEMWRAPSDILGKYCVLDAEACYLLYTEHLLPVLRMFPSLLEFYEKEWMYLIQVHIDQRMHGILIDRPALEERSGHLEELILHLEQKFLMHPEVRGHILQMEKEFLAELTAKEPPRWRKLPERPAEPPKYKKDGGISKNWLRWVELESKYTTPVQSLNWENWKERYDLAASGADRDYRYNMNSGPQMIDLLYTRLGYEVRITTESGLPGTGSDALQHMGEIGRILIERDDAVKELSFVTKYLELTAGKEVPTIHPGFRIPGPCTGRLSSNSPNLQQVPKTKAMMSLFLARPGMTWVDVDFRALENVVAAELSGDRNLYQLYGDDVPENDAHLFLAAHISAWKADIEATGYTPYNPPPGSVARAKKECKGHRNKAKTVVYACQYGGGVQKVYDTLVNNGVAVTYSEVETLHRTYWDLFSTLKRYGYSLKDEWKRRGGYIMNGIGRPMCVTEDYTKDLLSRSLQSTGHDILVKYIYIACHELDRRGIPWKPIVIDWHDSMCIEVPEDYGEAAKEVYEWSMVELNKQLQGNIQLGGTPTMGRTLADVKEPES